MLISLSDVREETDKILTDVRKQTDEADKQLDSTVSFTLKTYHSLSDEPVTMTSIVFIA